MPDPEMSPIPKSEQLGMAHYQADDDIELPPMPDGEPVPSSGSDWSQPRTADRSGGSSLAKSLGTLALLGAVIVGGWFNMFGASAEQKHENWQHVAAAAKASTETTSQLVQIDTSNASTVVPSIVVTSSDADRATSQKVRMALLRNDLVTATAMLQAGQQMPSPSQNPDVRPPVLDANSALSQALKEGRKELFQIELFDCCAEDGDIIEVVVNGESFATVPIMHAGTMLSIPLDRGNNTVTVRGVKDGGGGVTVSFRTSRGEYFAKYMDVGEEHTMGVVVQ